MTETIFIIRNPKYTQLKRIVPCKGDKDIFTEKLKNDSLMFSPTPIQVDKVIDCKNSELLTDMIYNFYKSEIHNINTMPENRGWLSVGLTVLVNDINKIKKDHGL